MKPKSPMEALRRAFQASPMTTANDLGFTSAIQEGGKGNTIILHKPADNAPTSDPTTWAWVIVCEPKQADEPAKVSVNGEIWYHGAKANRTFEVLDATLEALRQHNQNNQPEENQCDQ